MGTSMGRRVGEVERREVIRETGRRGRFRKAVQGQLDGSSVKSMSNILGYGQLVRARNEEVTYSLPTYCLTAHAPYAVNVI
jgi:hypothetical protein